MPSIHGKSCCSIHGNPCSRHLLELNSPQSSTRLDLYAVCWHKDTTKLYSEVGNTIIILQINLQLHKTVQLNMNFNRTEKEGQNLSSQIGNDWQSGSHKQAGD